MLDLTRFRHKKPMVIRHLLELSVDVEVYSLFHEPMGVDVRVNSICPLNFLEVLVRIASRLIKIHKALKPNIGRRERVVIRKIHFENEQVVFVVLVVIRQHYGEILMEAIIKALLVIILGPS